MKKLLWLLLLTSLVSGKTFYLAVLDLENTRSFEKFFEKIHFKNEDKIVVLDSSNAQYIFSTKLNFNTVRLFSKNNNEGFINHFYRELNEYKKYKDDVLEEKKNHCLIARSVNDFARTMKTVKNFIETYRDRYKEINVLLFGDSYLHNAYGHNFKHGIPTDGFIELEESEFNAFKDIDAKEIKVAIFYDEEPYVARDKLFRFYRKLFLKKFNTQLNSFNRSAVMGTEKNIEYEDKSFMNHKLQVIKEAKVEDCIGIDKINKNYDPLRAIIEIEIVNPCKKGAYITFSHNGKKRQEIADDNGRIKINFKAIAGSNIIKYRDKNVDKKIFDEIITSPENEISFLPDYAIGMVDILGNNPLREDGEEIELWHENTGNTLLLTYKNGKFKKTIPVELGQVNKFTWKDIRGKKHEISFDFSQKCTDKVELDKEFASENGIALVKLINDCREDGSLVEFYYKDKVYSSMIEKGQATNEIILRSDSNDIFYKDYENNKQKLATINIRDFNDLIRFMISYKDNVVLSMNIYEPSIKVDTTKAKFGISYDTPSEFREGHVHIKNTTSKVGKILIAQIPTLTDYLSQKYIKNYKQVYVTRKSKLKSGSIAFYVDYFSRHGRYSGQEPLCGKRSLGGVVVDYEILNESLITSSNKFLNPSRCTKSVEDGSLVPQNEDNELIFIKKVEIK